MQVLRAFGLLTMATLLTGCGSIGLPYGRGSVAGAPAAEPPHLALLVPLKASGSAPLGQAMANAAKLALAAPGSPPLETFDTGASPATAADSAHLAIEHGAKMIIGPLTAAETAAVTPIARSAHVPVLAFTSDPARAQPGVWVMGLTPAEQIRRLVEATRAEGRRRYAALLPRNALGDLLADALTGSLASAGMAPPTIRRYGGTASDRAAAVKDISGYASRRGPIDARLKAERESDDPEMRRRADDDAHQTIPPPPFDVLLLAESGDNLRSMTGLLATDDISPTQVRLIGPTFWAADAGKVHDLAGAWFAGPDPSARNGFVQRYQAQFGGQPPLLSDIAFDAAAIARVLARDNNLSLAGMTRPDGFAGVDGVLGLLPDGHVRRGLAIFEVDRGGSRIVLPAPQTLAAPGV